MSNKLLDAVWNYNAQNSGQKVVLLCLADHANAGGQCWPGIDRIAAMTGLKERMVQKHLTILQENGVIKIDHNQGTKTASGWTNRYTILLKGCTALHPSDSQEVYSSTPLHQGVYSSTPDGVYSSTPKPPVNPQLNHYDDDIPPTEKTPRKKQSNGTNGKDSLYPMALSLATICQKDLTIITSGEKQAIFKAAKTMGEKGYTPDDVASFGRWWQANDWRGQKGQPPTLAQVRSEWGRYRDSLRRIKVDLAKSNNNGEKIVL